MLKVNLTDTETEVLKLMADGKSYVEIAIIRNNSPHTIWSHVEQIKKKLDVYKNTALIAKALRSGVIK
jgi:LuxR family transcriptional regulator of spore coat protein